MRLVQTAPPYAPAGDIDSCQVGNHWLCWKPNHTRLRQVRWLHREPVGVHLRAYLDAQCVYGSVSGPQPRGPGIQYHRVYSPFRTCPRILHQLFDSLTVKPALSENSAFDSSLARPQTRPPPPQRLHSPDPGYPAPDLATASLNSHGRLHRPARGVHGDTRRCRPRRGEMDDRRCLCVKAFCDIQGWGSDGARVKWQRTREGESCVDLRRGRCLRSLFLIFTWNGRSELI